MRLNARAHFFSCRECWDGFLKTYGERQNEMERRSSSFEVSGRFSLDIAGRSEIYLECWDGFLRT